MNISLKDWKELDRIRKLVIKTIEIAESQSFAVFCKYRETGASETPESSLIFKFNQQLHELREPAWLLMDTHPQSEWMGGDSDNPKNHKLREPNCCPLPRRRFTQEEVDEANLECLGPCQWREKEIA